MGNSLQKSMLPFKIQQLLDIIIEKKKLEIKDALLYLYSSELYNQLSSESSNLWQFSSLSLYELLKKEKRLKKHNQNKSTPILLFLTFCIENYKEHRNIGAEETLLLFSKYNIFCYLEAVYEPLHTQSNEYIMSEIDTYINNKQNRL